MINIQLTPNQIAQLSDTISENFAQEQPERIYCYEMNGNEVESDFFNKEGKIGNKSWSRKNSSLFFFERRLDSYIFYNFIVEYTSLNAVFCSDEYSDGQEPFVVAVDVNIHNAIDLSKNYFSRSNFNTIKN